MERNEITEKYNNQKKFFYTHQTKNIEFRLNQLLILKKAIEEYESKIIEALKKDLNKPPVESYAAEIGFTLLELDFMIKNIKSLAKPKKVPTSFINAIGKSYIHNEPFGNVLIIAPWNYPFQLLIAPLIGSIAAGNVSILKPSEFTPETTKVIKEMIKKHFNEEFVCVIDGEVKETQILLEQKFDYIFFTGSTIVGKIVMQAAAKNLTPVTLELGGKSPCIIDDDINIEVTAKRIAWGKFLNAGQTCIAPDYLLVKKSVKTKFIAELKNTIKKFYGENVLENKDFVKIINEKHFERLVKHLTGGGEITFGGKYDKNKLLIEPTIMEQVSDNSSVMNEEIFGPILPVIEYEKIEEAIDYINRRSKPLALYLFTKNKELQKKITKEISAGGVCINDTLSHIASTELPFGGVGDSGIGFYHGKYSFYTFSHPKSVMTKSFTVDPDLKYPPYKITLEKLKKLLKWFG